ncbi:hypothetical protein [Leptospira andrefontaineae]|uniref:Uncharacterized protein n=1 Tax=Leptospira andrefontaineae TaxID=2484976 RepID=A0A4R9H6R2_9LEPT|nr:hypothetical protein [Leptospira andrefontaineae]TGK41207.1 hypothetical protein EHO65_07180 [Leptospira andrefontaineae]
MEKVVKGVTLPKDKKVSSLKEARSEIIKRASSSPGLIHSHKRSSDRGVIVRSESVERFVNRKVSKYIIEPESDFSSWFFLSLPELPND